MHGADWLLLDDILRQDHQRVSVHGLLSPIFVLACGTAQGRRFSVHVFNSLLRWLADEVRQVLPVGCAAWLPPFARAVLDAAESILPTVRGSFSPCHPTLAHSLPECVARVLPSDVPPWERTKALVMDVLTQLPLQPDRVAAV